MGLNITHNLNAKKYEKRDYKYKRFYFRDH